MIVVIGRKTLQTAVSRCWSSLTCVPEKGQLPKVLPRNAVLTSVIGAQKALWGSENVFEVLAVAR